MDLVLIRLLVHWKWICYLTGKKGLNVFGKVSTGISDDEEGEEGEEDKEKNEKVKQFEVIDKD